MKPQGRTEKKGQSSLEKVTQQGQSHLKKTSGSLETSPEEKIGHVSMAVDSEMVAKKKELHSFSVATVVDTTQGIPNAESIAGAMAIQFDPEWQWNVKPFRDGRFLLQFPSPEFARDVENLGTVRFPGFSLSLCPWSDDLFPHEKLDRECRWVTINRLPLYCLRRDTVARIIEPVGYLDTLKEGAYADQRRAYIRVRRGRRLPCIIHLSIESWKYTVIVDMETGQEPLPWDTYTPGKQTTPMTSRTEYGTSPESMGATSDDDVDATSLTSDGDKSSPYDAVGATSDDDMDATLDEMDPTD
ncbi:hypothetical protein J5N97_006075 [Dioscorea zingiberensis]|uniref:DUF4283 domain-containing protein n=1 Tax=Dioscorea zingiberensis TaxID=325984 RepID=A0A9D5DA96_9LILI|nr:hypothetical protein J5N97_006075 [Dioscorea zingiberensis]